MSVNPPAPLRVVLDHKIKVPVGELVRAGLLEDLTEALSIPNQAKIHARKVHQWDWRMMPDEINLWEIEPNIDGDYFTMPRGFLETFEEGMQIAGHEYEIYDYRTFNHLLKIGSPSQAKPWQSPAIDAIRMIMQGIYKAPAGSGKTVAVLLAIQRLGCKSLVIINTKDILRQWQQRVIDHLGPDYPVGQIGDNVFEVSPYITIATAQTLHSRYEELEEEGFFHQFSFVCLDECHHATAETYNRLMNRFTARYRIGVSATPDKTGDFALATLVLGPVFYETKPEDVDTLIKPKIIRVPTRFTFPFRGPRPGRPSNYGKMIEAMIENQARNDLIVARILHNQGHHQLVISKRLEHLKILDAMLSDEGFEDEVVSLTGQDSKEDREYAIALAASKPSVVLSTLADEALDIPRLDRLHLTFPQKNAGLVTQQVGRLERVHHEKDDAIIYDYADLKIGPLEKQWMIRRSDVYVPRGYEIVGRQDQLVG